MGAVQQSFAYPPGWGGRRKGAGRKPNGEKRGVPHLEREDLSSNHPVHVTVRMRYGVWNLRTRRCFEPILGAMIAAARRTEFHVVHHSVQGNHIHFIVEAASKTHLSRGMQALCIRIALGLNRVMGRKGRVFADRYHAHILKAPSEVANALRYVLGNRVIHMQRLGRQLDVKDFASRYETTLDVPFTEPATWLLSKGWQRAPRLRL